ncbi:hypothetical protein D8B26_003325 [Coccidioides posadasii str. Silveira]|uniref:Ser/Thr protein phosphatase n=3 Tax=Coccidioides posadasii TaxID=199306 RepID=E9D003_COCPS|nr:calcineurin-like phosphoesterase, putative [Coccidioides posadasii C735 delta SOWgp]EER26314.1 calcineurin-like phosphoesterase, putative [Coccidioides posadasii C735 delta SOWgp]EFW20256.1 Ser/Thr protein phosphatase [Coccidioides posadasii str. Silveira]KMM73181.1 calcineurin-like phosphoesterase [Coccidioides posadasii RMSCC 3488]QVM08644.1 hypothetical protein D8B26_003325 [Coccidioides posadasii str. Silveira]|eukprot:XP_003068459.1 calcineurin-like phosphoesterase, putative [Coccidioides posadasii C735 delta SOWgp]
MVRTRFVCVSDTHGYSTADAAFKLPKGDVLIHAGDITNRGTEKELDKSLKWIMEADFEAKIIIAGNHDTLLDPNLSQNQKLSWEEKPWRRLQGLTEYTFASQFIYLNHEAKEIRLRSPHGPKTRFKVFGSPYSPILPGWGFGYLPEHAKSIWDEIPSDADILITHTPPAGHLDIANGKSIGCQALWQRLWDVRPRLVICGHVHESRGYHRVRWPSGPSKEYETVFGNLPARQSKEQSTIDLCRKIENRLDNDGLARHETCIVNAAIMATSWPHKGGKKFNSPIVVDLDLPQL